MEVLRRMDTDYMTNTERTERALVSFAGTSRGWISSTLKLPTWLRSLCTVAFKKGVWQRASLQLTVSLLFLNIHCADNDFRFGSNPGNGDPLTVEGFLALNIFHSLLCPNELFLPVRTAEQSVTVDGQFNEYGVDTLVFSDSSGDSAAGSGTDLRQIHMAISNVQETRLLLFVRLDSAPSTTHGFRFLVGGFELQLKNIGGNPSFQTLPGSCETTATLATGPEGYEIAVPPECLALSVPGQLQIDSVNSDIKVFDNSDFTGFVDRLNPARRCLTLSRH